MKYVISMLVGSCLFLTSVAQSYTFHIIKPTGLDANHLGLNAVLFESRDTGFLAGSSDSINGSSYITNEKLNLASEIALLYKTTDGGRIWEGKSFGNGFITDIKKLNGVIYLFKTDPDQAHVHIYSSANEGNEWKEETNFPDHLSQLLINDGIYYAVGSDTGNRKTYIYLSKDKGHSWNEVTIHLSSALDDIFLRNGIFYYLANDDSDDYFAGRLIEYDLQSGASKTISLQKGFKPYILSDYQNDIRIIGTMNDRIAVYSVNEKGSLLLKYTYVKSNAYYPQYYFNNQHEDWIMVRDTKNNRRPTQILRTMDTGKSWEIIDCAGADTFSPFYLTTLENEITGWFYSVKGFLFVLDKKGD